MSNRDQLKQLLMDTFLIAEEGFRFDLSQSEVPTWDSLGTVSLAVGIQQTFGFHMTPDEALSIRSFTDIVNILEAKGIDLNG